MREIIFRGKRLDNGEWAYGYFCEFANNRTGEQETYIQTVKKDGRIDLLHKVDPDTVGQFSGLTDKNGTRIFEGDICRNTKTGDIVSVGWHGTMGGFVWSKRREDSSLHDFGELFRAFDKYEVIGNIHDNPELIGERKDNE